MIQKSFIQEISEKIHQLGLVAPVILLLEAHKPLAFIGSQLLLIAQPTLDLFLPNQLTTRSANFLADPTQLEQLITILEKSPPPQPQNVETYRQQEPG